MAKPQTRSETALQSAVMRFGDDAFRICYMHTKSGKETLTLLSDVFMQYFLDTQTFKSEGEERLWVLRTTHDLSPCWLHRLNKLLFPLFCCRRK